MLATPPVFDAWLSTPTPTRSLRFRGRRPPFRWSLGCKSAALAARLLPLDISLFRITEVRNRRPLA